MLPEMGAEDSAFRAIDSAVERGYNQFSLGLGSVLRPALPKS
jgi:hypothetical protein